MVYEGDLNAEGLKICAVVSRFNDLVTEKLLAGAKHCFLRSGGSEKDFDVVYVAGCFELPLLAKKVAQSGKYNGIAALGCVIKGETAHFDYIASEAAKGLSHVSLSEGIPMGFGMLTTDTLEQALERAGGKYGNKGWQTCLALIETIQVLKAF